MRSILEYLAIIVCLVIIVSLGVWAYQLSQFKAHVQYAQLPDATIAYYIRGQGEPLLLLPGFGMSMEDWDPAFIRSLAEKHQLLVFDFRGVGFSKGKIDGMTIQQMTDDTVELLNVLSIQKTDVLGWSMGSLIGQELTLSHPERVRKLILASTLSGDSHSIDASQEIGDYVQQNLDGSLKDVLISTMFLPTPEGREAMTLYLKRREQALKTGEAPASPGEITKVKIAQEEAMGQLHETNDRLQNLSQISVPTLVIAGKEDALIPIENDQMVASAIPHAKLITFPSLGHAFLFANKKEVIEAIEDFLH